MKLKVLGLISILPNTETVPSRMLKKSARGVLGPLSYSRTPVYASRANGPAALPAERRVSARLGWEGKTEAFFNSLLVMVTCHLKPNQKFEARPESWIAIFLKAAKEVYSWNEVLANGLLKAGPNSCCSSIDERGTTDRIFAAP